MVVMSDKGVIYTPIILRLVC